MEKNGVKRKITNELLAFWENVIFPYLEKRFGEVDIRFGKVENGLDGVENRLGKVETELRYVKNDVRDLKADTPTAKQFANHEKRISRLENIVPSQ